MTVGEIADAAEVTVPVIYQRFGSKAELFIAVAEDAYDRGLRHLKSAISGVSSFDAAIDTILDAVVSLNRLDRHTTAMVLIVLAEARRYAELSAELRPTLHGLGAFFDDIAKLAPPDLRTGSPRATRSLPRSDQRVRRAGERGDDDRRRRRLRALSRRYAFPDRHTASNADADAVNGLADVADLLTVGVKS